MMAKIRPIGIPRLIPDQAAPSSVVSPILKSRPPRNIPETMPSKAANTAAMPDIISATTTPRSSSLDIGSPSVQNDHLIPRLAKQFWLSVSILLPQSDQVEGKWRKQAIALKSPGSRSISEMAILRQLSFPDRYYRRVKLRLRSHTERQSVQSIGR